MIPHARATLVLLALTSGCAVSMGPPATRPEHLPISMYDADGARLGVITLDSDSTGIRLTVDLQGLQPGVHGIHIHATGRCDRPDFLSAGPHLDHQGPHQHGLQSAAGPHTGDLESITVGADGSVRTVLRFPARGGRLPRNVLFDHDGASIIIHAAPDDGVTQPSGQSGPRIACGIVA